ncbi:MAG TPA: hypothetical protein VLM85_04780 [Polyangiaceae bacterium]|nr:hypothetical protein [Polyangiaceae bacterium]
MIALALAACSDNNPTTDAGPDGSLPDANKPDVVADAPSDAPQGDAGDGGAMAVSGTVLLADMTFVDPEAAAVGGVNGGYHVFSFSNTSVGKGGLVVSGTSPIGGCLVTQYDPTHLPNGTLDANTITVADAPGDSGATTGLLKTVGPCNYNSTLGEYLCVSNNETGQAVGAVGTDSVVPGTVTFQLTKAVTGENLVGSYLMVNGFTNPDYNSGASAFPIINQPDATHLMVVDTNHLNDSGAAPTDLAEAATAVSYTVLNAAGPVPIAGQAADFLGTGSITISKPANSVWPAINFTASVPGDGWTLTDPGNPSALPLTGTASADIVFGCGTAGADGGSTCGPESNAPVKIVTLLNGHATKKSVAGLPAFVMPTDVDGTDTYLTFQCAALGVHSATLTKAAQQAIINFNPTRVELAVINGAGNILTSGSNQTNLIIGHALVGHTTHP